MLRVVQNALVLAVCGLLLSCAGQLDVARDAPLTIIRNALVIDGTGAVGRRADVSFRGDRIIAIGTIVAAPGDVVIDAEGLALAPGFIDTHSHHDEGMFETPDMRAVVSQGVTTIIVGQDGFSSYPLSDFYARLSNEPVTVNVGSYTGHNTLRDLAMTGGGTRESSAGENAAMARLLAADMDAGSFGLSTGLEYDTGVYSNREEVLALARVSASHGGRYISHLRSEDVGLRDAIEEIIEIGRVTGQPVQISHLKIAGLRDWGSASSLLQRLDRARAEGVDITADVYPYTYWQSTIRVLLPERDFTDRAAVQRAFDTLVRPEGLILTRYAPDPSLVGQSVAAIAQSRGVDPVTAYIDLVARLDAYDRVADGSDEAESVIGFSMSDDDVAAILAWQHSNLCSDGSLASGHPRGYGAFPRFLGRYVRERGILSLEEAVRRMTGLAAVHMGLTDRGVIAPGYFADLVLFDPTTIVDRATVEAPHEESEGVVSVWVNGQAVFGRDLRGEVAPRPGMVLRRATPGAN